MKTTRRPRRQTITVLRIDPPDGALEYQVRSVDDEELTSLSLRELKDLVRAGQRALDARKGGGHAP